MGNLPFNGDGKNKPFQADVSIETIIDFSKSLTNIGQLIKAKALNAETHDQFMDSVPTIVNMKHDFPVKKKIETFAFSFSGETAPFMARAFKNILTSEDFTLQAEVKGSSKFDSALIVSGTADDMKSALTVIELFERAITSPVSQKRLHEVLSIASLIEKTQTCLIDVHFDSSFEFGQMQVQPVIKGIIAPDDTPLLKSLLEFHRKFDLKPLSDWVDSDCVIHPYGLQLVSKNKDGEDILMDVIWDLVPSEELMKIMAPDVLKILQNPTPPPPVEEPPTYSDC